MTTSAPPEHPLNVLVVGVEDWAIEQAATSLTLAGHQVLRCHEPGQPAFPCNAFLPERTCPLVVGFDVALTVRSRPAVVPAPGEVGVICALGRAIPLVVAGLGGEGFADHAAMVVDHHDSVVTACEAVAVPRLV